MKTLLKSGLVSALLLSGILTVIIGCISSASGLTNDIGLSVVVNPNITQFITNNYTINNYTGWSFLNPPWLYNITGDAYFNYTRLIQEFYNKTDINNKGYLNSSYNATYAATSADVTANRTSWLTNCYNASYLTSYTDTFLGNWSTYHNSNWDTAYGWGNHVIDYAMP